MLNLFLVLDGWLGEVNLLEHHDVVFDLLSMLSLSQLTV